MSKPAKPRYPRWIALALDRHLAAIERTYQITIPTEDPLGCGNWGCVLPTSDERLVLKITRDPTEGPMMAMFRRLQQSQVAEVQDGVAAVLDVRRVTVTYRGRPDISAFTVLRENIRPLDYNGTELHRGISLLLDVIRDAAIRRSFSRDRDRARPRMVPARTRPRRGR